MNNDIFNIGELVDAMEGKKGEYNKAVASGDGDPEKIARQQLDLLHAILQKIAVKDVVLANNLAWCFKTGAILGRGISDIENLFDDVMVSK